MISTFDGAWDLYAQGAYLVLRCVVGWSKKGRALMGRGLCLEAADRYPTLYTWWGAQCRTHREKTPVSVIDHVDEGDTYRFVLAPVVPMSEEFPEHSWRKKSDPVYVERALLQLAELPIEPFAVLGIPPLWGEATGLPERIILPMMKRHLRGDRWRLLERPEAPKQLL